MCVCVCVHACMLIMYFADLEEELVFDEDDFRPYNMSPDRLLYIGVCIVFNNIHFRVSEYRSRRPGSAVDFRHIERVFR